MLMSLPKQEKQKKEKGARNMHTEYLCRKRNYVLCYESRNKDSRVQKVGWCLSYEYYLLMSEEGIRFPGSVLQIAVNYHEAAGS